MLSAIEHIVAQAAKESVCVHHGFACMFPVLIQCFRELASGMCPAVYHALHGSLFICFVTVCLDDTTIAADEFPCRVTAM